MVGLSSFLSAKHSPTGIRLASAGSDVVLKKQCEPLNIKTLSDRLVAATENNANAPFVIRRLAPLLLGYQD